MWRWRGRGGSKENPKISKAICSNHSEMLILNVIDNISTITFEEKSVREGLEESNCDEERVANRLRCMSS